MTAPEAARPRVTSGAITRDLLGRSRRVLLGVVVLGLLALGGTFAEIIASPAPIVAFGPSGVHLLPGIVHARLYEGRTRAEVEHLHDGEHAVWPIVRFGARTLDDAGPNAPSSRAHPFGTDARGRDLFARLLYGARTALGLSLLAVSLGMIVGVALGGIAGYERGFWDDRLLRLIETIDTFPAIIVVALVRAIERQPSALSIAIGSAFVRWAEIARLVRVDVIRAATSEYVTAARALGASPRRVFTRHVLPNAIGSAVISAVFGLGSVVLLEAAISFLGMGGESRVASWGETLAEGARDPGRIRLLLLPSALLVATVGSTYLLASALREASDPRAPRDAR